MGMMLRRNIKARLAKTTPKKEIKVEKPIEKPEVAANTGEVVWTVDEIQKMPFMKLKSIAKRNGVDVDDKKAEDIRSELIEKLGI